MTQLLSTVGGSALVAIGLLGIASLTVGYLSKYGQRRYELQVEKIRAELQSERMRLDAGVHEPRATATAQLDPVSATALADQYHARSLAQSQRSFTFSLIAAAMGFVVIVGAVLMIGFSGGDKTAAALVQILAAAVIEAVAGLFFTLSN
ncbi:TRADD-N-associated membrane domain-containing protein, partial [Nocardia beijingensis]